MKSMTQRQAHHLKWMKKGARGHKNKLFKSRANFDTRKYFFSMRVVDTWNGFLAEVVEAKTTNSFKNGLAKFWKNHPLISNRHMSFWKLLQTSRSLVVSVV